MCPATGEDAELIARCTAAAETIHAPPDPHLAPFAEYLRLLNQLGEDVACLKTRRETCREPRIKDHWNEEIARLPALCRRELKQLVAAGDASLQLNSTVGVKM